MGISDPTDKQNQTVVQQHVPHRQPLPATSPGWGWGFRIAASYVGNHWLRLTVTQFAVQRKIPLPLGARRMYFPAMRCMRLSGEAMFAMPGLGKSLHPE